MHIKQFNNIDPPEHIKSIPGGQNKFIEHPQHEHRQQDMTIVIITVTAGDDILYNVLRK